MLAAGAIRVASGVTCQAGTVAGHTRKTSCVGAHRGAQIVLWHSPIGFYMWARKGMLSNSCWPVLDPLYHGRWLSRNERFFSGVEACVRLAVNLTGVGLMLRDFVASYFELWKRLAERDRLGPWP